MSQLTEHVSLTITADTVGQARAGFGVMMILSHNATWVERTRTYEGIDDVAEDWATDSPEYLAANVAFAQTPHPEEIMIGRAGAKPTQVYVIGVNLVANSAKYGVTVASQGATITNPIEYTSDSSATNDEIVAGLVAALNAVTGKNYTAAATGSVGAQVCTVTANAAGNWFALAVDPTYLTIKQTHVDPGVTAEITAISNEDDSWYAIITLYNSKAYVQSVANAIEATGSKMYFFDVNETDSINLAVGSSPTDTLYTLFATKYNRVAGSYYPNPATMFTAAWLGRVLPDEPGSETWKGKTLELVAAVGLSTTQRKNLRDRKANSYTTIGSENKTWEGTVLGGSFGFIDVTRGLDWLYDDMTKGVFDAAFSGEKLPYTNAGIAVVRNAIKTSLKRAVARGILTDNPQPEIDVPDIADVSDSDKQLRNLPDVNWNATLAGAIHTIKIKGMVSA
jgi:hypothetical protein